MARQLRVLMVGESWIKHTVHMKGFDHFVSVEYEEGAGEFLACLGRSGFEVTYVRAHEISAKFPTTPEELDTYDVVIISDVGANSFLLCDETFLRSERSVNRLDLLVDRVRRGGGLVMVGGYMSFAGIDGRARYGASPLAAVLPVTIADHDDRVETPQGLVPQLVDSAHDVTSGLPDRWPFLLGYNRLRAKPDAEVLAQVGDDPLLVVGEAGQGRTVAFASDLAPHWAPPEFVAWTHYEPLWARLVRWSAGVESQPAVPVAPAAAR
jgi:uncharacterized membrane protein